MAGPPHTSSVGSPRAASCALMRTGVSPGSRRFQTNENGGVTAPLRISPLLRSTSSAGSLTVIGFSSHLKAFKEGGFEGRGANGMTYDWKRWDGTPNGYEGFLADNLWLLRR